MTNEDIVREVVRAAVAAVAQVVVGLVGPAAMKFSLPNPVVQALTREVRREARRREDGLIDTLLTGRLADTLKALHVDEGSAVTREREGEVIYISEGGRHGWIRPDDGSRYAHLQAGRLGTLAVGDRVRFQAVPGPNRGPEAVGVILVPDARPGEADDDDDDRGY